VAFAKSGVTVADLHHVFSIVLKVKLSLKVPANDLFGLALAGLLPWTAFMTGFWLQWGL